jgi:hypothetical protein
MEASKATIYTPEPTPEPKSRQEWLLKMAEQRLMEAKERVANAKIERDMAVVAVRVEKAKTTCEFCGDTLAGATPDRLAMECLGARDHLEPAGTTCRVTTPNNLHP